jgi:hypothetical protein
MKMRGPAVAGFLAALFVLAAGGEARAQVQCEVLNIQASTEGTSVSEALQSYSSRLMRPPLNGFTSFTLTSTQRLQLTAGRSQPLNLGHGISGELRLTSTRREGSRLRLRLILRRGDQTLLNTLVVVSAGHPFFVAGPIIPGGTLVVGISCQ